MKLSVYRGRIILTK